MQPGDTIGICAPAGPVPEDELFRGVDLLHKRGYRTKVAAATVTEVQPLRYLANDDRSRLQGLHELLVDDDVGMVLCARGGYGTQRLYPYLPPLMRDYPNKVLCGYSDITGLHTAFRGRLTRIHGPNLSTLLAMDDLSSCWFWNLVEQHVAAVELPETETTLDVLVPGTASGVLEGGNLCILAHCCGTQFQPQFSNCIVLLEDVGEPLYRVDRYLTQLINSGALYNAVGFILGTVSPAAGATETVDSGELRQLWLDRLAPLQVPVVAGARFGHVANPYALPMGVHATLDADCRKITIQTPMNTG